MFQLGKVTLALMALSTSMIVKAETAQPTQQLSVIEVTASEALNQTVDAKSLKEKSVTLGDALKDKSGIHSNQFGGGASAPIIHGQEGYRNKIVQHGADVIDMANTSPDHAIMVEPSLAKQIDIVSGIETLRYGTGVTGGVVDVKDGKIATIMPNKGIEGEIGFRFNTGNDEKLTTAGVTVGLGSQVALRLEGLTRKANDYHVARYTAENHDHEKERFSHVENTHAKSTSGSVGLSWVGSRGYLGLAYSDRKDRYGLPGHSDEYHDCHTHLGTKEGLELHCGGHGDDDHDHAHDHDDAHMPPEVDLRVKRYDLRGELSNPVPGFSTVRLLASHTNYKHDEVEGTEAVSFFRNRAKQVNLEAEHQPWANVTGTWGLFYGQNRMSILGEEELLREVNQKNWGAFAIERLAFDKFDVKLGGRVERYQLNSADTRVAQPNYTTTTYGYGTGVDWKVTPAMTWSLNLSHQQRAPSAMELYARGLHLASNTYEWGDDQYDAVMKRALSRLSAQQLEEYMGVTDTDAFVTQYKINQRLNKEKANQVELGVQYKTDRAGYQLKGFYKDYDGYIYGRTLDRMENFRLIRYTQADAKFYGVEGAMNYDITPIYRIGLFGDYVRGKIDGENAPRVPAARLGTHVVANFSPNLQGNMRFTHHFAQNRIANYEDKTPSSNIVDVGLSYQQKWNNQLAYRVFFNANNVFDEPVYSHSSFLANLPQMGRNFSLGVNYKF